MRLWCIAACPLCNTGPYAPQLPIVSAMARIRGNQFHAFGADAAGAAAAGVALSVAAAAAGAAGGACGDAARTVTAPNITIISPAKNQGPISFIRPAR